MAVVMLVRSEGLEGDRYDRLVAGLDLDVNPPFGQLLHLAAERGRAVEIVEVWQTASAALSYVEHRLGPGLEAVRAGTPEVELVALHNLFAPDLDTVGLIGGVSLPGHVAGAALS